LDFLADASFDAVVMAFNTIDYVLPDVVRMRCIQECRRILRSGGVLIFSSHNPRSTIVRPAWNAGRVIKMARRLSRGSAFWEHLFEASLSAAMSVFAFTRCSIRSLVKISQKTRTKAFWKGTGLWLDPSHGGLVTHTWTPSRCIQEVTSAGFQITKYLGDDFPRASGEFVTDWYYYVFKKI
jgi:SAM-dependent methyltransferase